MISSSQRFAPKPDDLQSWIRQNAVPFTGQPQDFDKILEMVDNRHFVLIGEATHGTHEFYTYRAQITRRLIEEKGFNLIMAEADWPDAYMINRFVKGLSPSQKAIDSLAGFERFPQWMWRNADVLGFVEWLGKFNQPLPFEKKVGFFGLDLYSLYNSMEAVLRYLSKVDPEAAERARKRYGCFSAFSEDAQAYGQSSYFGLTRDCEDEVVAQLMDLREKSRQYMSLDGRKAMDEYMFIEQNAQVVKDAEEYYRQMFGGRVSSWNLRDKHMMSALTHLVKYHAQVGAEPKVVVWAHNSHLGDARATQVSDFGELNLGQLVREEYGSDAVLIGFSTYSGEVTAASQWDGTAERMTVRPALAGSYEEVFHSVNLPAYLLALDRTHKEGLQQPRLQRAIGVIYSPLTERQSHYYYATIINQFDAIIHIDDTQAVEPIEKSVAWQTGEAAETYPYGL